MRLYFYTSILIQLLAGVALAEAYRAPAGLRELTPMLPVPQATPRPDLAGWDIDPEYLPYVQEFKRDYFKYRRKLLTVGQLKIVSTINGSADAGVCHRREGYKWIEIDRLRGGWGRYTQCQRVNLIYHEMGHCVLNEEHTKGGIMNPRVLDAKVCEGNLEAFKKALFEGERQPRLDRYELIYTYETEEEE